MDYFNNLEKLASQLAVWRSQKKSIVLVTGCFDILHSEHVKFLNQAKTKGDILVVGLESDQRVCQLKGKGRPVNRLPKRATKLVATGIPDAVFFLPEEFGSSLQHEALVAKIRPDILAVSSHTLHLDKKKEIVGRYGGELRVVLSFNPNISTTKILKHS